MRRLTSLEVKKIRDELAELRKLIAELDGYLSDEQKLRNLVAKELAAFAEPLTVPRHSRIVSAKESAAADSGDPDDVEVPDVAVKVTLTATGKLGRFDATAKAGGRGKDDAIVASVTCSLRDDITAITDTGRAITVHPIDVPACEGKDRGAKVGDIIASLEDHENIIALLSLTDETVVVLVTRSGAVKKIERASFAKKDGQPVLSFKADGDLLVFAGVDAPGGHIMLLSSAGQLLRFETGNVRPQGRTGSGVAGMRLGEDTVVAAAVANVDQAPVCVALVTDNALAKVTPVSVYPAKGRGGAGVRALRGTGGGERVTAAAFATTDGLVGVSASGSLTGLPEVSEKRDGPGTECGAVTFASRRP